MVGRGAHRSSWMPIQWTSPVRCHGALRSMRVLADTPRSDMMIEPGVEHEFCWTLRPMTAKRTDDTEFLRTAICLSILVVAGVLVYANGLDAPFFMDDASGIVENRDIRNFSDPLRLFGSATPISGGRPVAAFTFAINYAIHKLEVRGYHIFNLGVHVLAAVVLFGVVRRTLLTLPQWIGMSATRLALICALVWMLHPVHAECINYVSQRTESLMGLFYFLTVYCAIRALRSARARCWHVACVGACALGMATKQVMVTAPVMVFLYDFTFSARPFSDTLRRRRGLYAGLAATWLVLAGLMIGFPDTAVGDNPNVRNSDYAIEQCIMIVGYIGRVFWPASLIADYGYPRVRPLGEAAPYAMLLAPLLVGAAVLFVRHRQFGFGGVWFFITLAPTSSFVAITTEVGAERRLYVPLAGLVGMVIVGGYWVVQRVLGGARGASDGGIGSERAASIRWPCRVVTVLVLGALALRTIWRNEDYRSAVRIAQSVVDALPKNYRAQTGLGLALFESGRVEEGLEHMRTACELGPGYDVAHNNFGSALVKVGRIEEAVKYFRRAIEVRPSYAEAHNHLGSALRKMGSMDEAFREFQLALRFDPELAEGYYNLANAFGAIGKPDEAVRHYREAMRLKADYGDAMYNMGNVLLQMGRFEEGAVMFQRVTELEPSDASAHFNLAVALVKLGRSAEAVASLKVATEIQPGHVKARLLLGDQYRARGEVYRAIDEYRRAVESDGDLALAHYRLAGGLCDAGNYDEALAALANAIRLDPQWAEPLVETAWILSTHPDARQCRPVDAVNAAERACALVERPTARMLDALAAAYAAAGEFAKAASFGEEAVQQAEIENDIATIAAIRARVALYRQNQRYIERGAVR